ncbi:YecA family protein [Pelomonas sp. KK5]|uniref:YecA/YgfB family protein n=1 Tax=Pelomonas sp. KK5 TaxID=1855730 RepID=UPI00097C829D|nr:YecA family protein [Pelomonas sp. KK5]
MSTTRNTDLTDAEFAELDELLATTPAPLQPLDASMLDGYLCGVLVQPRLIEIDEWLPNIFDYDGGLLPEAGVDAAWLARIRELVERRHTALNRQLVEDGWFDPVVLDLEGGEEEGAEQPKPENEDAEQAAARATYEGMSLISRTLMPWVAGFQHANLCFPDLNEVDDEAVMAAMARLYRHLPAETDEEKEIVATLDREYPLKDLDDAIEELVVSVADLCDLTEQQRYAVETIRRAEPKLGRNDPCHCGSGRKYKQCHGAN